jgi:hypothetical protein
VVAAVDALDDLGLRLGLLGAVEEQFEDPGAGGGLEVVEAAEAVAEEGQG